jgi:hypothetical protein
MTDSVPQPKRIPPREASFVLCEDIREEIGNKYSLIGIFVSDDITLPIGSYKAGAKISSLCVFARVRGGEGLFNQKLILETPSGKSTEVDAGSVELKKGTVHLVNFQIRPFALDGLGTYTVTLLFDDNRYSFPFVLRYEDVKEEARA